MRHLSLCLTILASCRSPSPFDLFVTNPIDASDSYPEVVMLNAISADGSTSYCTGTFVSKSRILTAAHCFFDDNGRPAAKITYTDKKGVVHIGKMTASKGYDPMAGLMPSIAKKDMGLVSFTKDLAPAVANLGKAKLVVGQKIKMVGYGMTDTVNNTGDGRKNMGENSIENISDNMASSRGYASPPPREVKAGIFSATGIGDSGGAVFNERDELIGVIQSGTLAKIVTSEKSAKKSFFINVSHPFSIGVINNITARSCRGEYL